MVDISLVGSTNHEKEIKNSHKCANFLSVDVAPGVDLGVDPSGWLYWIQKELDTHSFSTAAENIESLKQSLYVCRGLDLETFHPALNRMLSRIVARLRKWGKATARSGKNTEEDRSPPIPIETVWDPFKDSISEKSDLVDPP